MSKRRQEVLQIYRVMRYPTAQGFQGRERGLSARLQKGGRRTRAQRMFQVAELKDSEPASPVGEKGSHKECKVAEGQTGDGAGGSNNKIILQAIGIY